ncbi:MAG: hypothetical protein V7L23_37105 [Nostoc sp.]
MQIRCGTAYLSTSTSKTEADASSYRASQSNCPGSPDFLAVG